MGGKISGTTFWTAISAEQANRSRSIDPTNILRIRSPTIPKRNRSSRSICSIGNRPELDAVADAIVADVLEHGIDPTNVLVIPLGTPSAIRSTGAKLADRLTERSLEVNLVWGRATRAFSEMMTVTISGINRAKGTRPRKYLLGIDYLEIRIPTGTTTASKPKRGVRRNYTDAKRGVTLRARVTIRRCSMNSRRWSNRSPMPIPRSRFPHRTRPRSKTRSVPTRRSQRRSTSSDRLGPIIILLSRSRVAVATMVGVRFTGAFARF